MTDRPLERVAYDSEEAATVHALAAPQERWLTRTELAAWWGMSLKTLDALVKEGMPSETWGRKMRRFNLAEVEAWRRGRAA